MAVLLTAHRELWLQDLDGHTVVLSAPDGEDQSQVDLTPLEPSGPDT